jgi:DNA-binding response OmpR family regulator
MNQHKNILIVDDDEAILRGLSSLFTQAGYLVQTATSGQQTLAMIDPKPNLIVLDLILPGLAMVTRFAAASANSRLIFPF